MVDLSPVVQNSLQSTLSIKQTNTKTKRQFIGVLVKRFAVDESVFMTAHLDPVVFNVLMLTSHICWLTLQWEWIGTYNLYGGTKLL